jgi:hypothetical protein
MGWRVGRTEVAERKPYLRFALTAAAILAVGLAPAGCLRGTGTQTEPTTTASAPSPLLPPREALAAAATSTENQSFAFTMSAQSAGIRYSGTRDAEGNSSTEIFGQTRLLVVGTSAYVKLGPDLVTQSNDPVLKQLGDTWVRPNDGWFSRSFLSFLLPAKRAMTPGAYLNGVVTAEGSSDGTYAGTLDIGKSTPSVFAAPNCLPDDPIVPFTARLDQEQRLAEITLSLGLERWVTTYSDFGGPADVEAPPSSEIVEAPLAFYQFFGDTGCII